MNANDVAAVLVRRMLLGEPLLPIPHASQDLAMLAYTIDRQSAMIERVIAFCEDRRVEDVNGGRTDADTVWPSDVLRVLRGERPYA